MTVLLVCLVVLLVLQCLALREIRRIRNEIAQRGGELIAGARALITAVRFLSGLKSSDSFTGAIPERAFEVHRNDMIDLARDRAHDLAVLLGDEQPRLVVPDDASRNIGGLGKDYVAEHEAQEGS